MTPGPEIGYWRFWRRLWPRSLISNLIQMTMTAILHVTLLGSPTVKVDGETITGFVSSKAAALLYYLAATGRVHTRDALAALLWPDAPEAVAKKNLRDVLSNLRHLLEPYLEITRQSVGLRGDAAVTVDSLWFATAVQSALCEKDTPARTAHLREAIKHYGGEFLQGFHLAETDLFEEWLRNERQHLRQLALQALNHLVDDAMQRGAHLEGIDYATRLLALEPWAEETHRHLMTLLAMSGQRSAALAQFEICRRILDEELGVEPAEETVELYERLLATPNQPRHNLPADLQSAPFVGRSDEIAELNQLLANAECRLVTLAGLGGVGKTRLALQVAAANLNRFLDGVYFVPLSALDAPERLVSAIGDALGFTFPSSEPPQAQLLHYLRTKTLLLVLDNFEHLLSPAAAGAADGQGVGLLAEVIRTAPGVKLLVTSRERLNLRAEWLFAVTGLPTTVNDTSEKSAADPAASAAVQLFLQRARRALTHFTPDAEDLRYIEQICRQVEGLPLGIELAASWTPVLTCQEIVAELAQGLEILTSPLRDAPAHQQSIHAVFDQSWRLLTGAEQQTLARLTVFRGGFRREAGQRVAGATLGQLSTLLNKSLVQRDSNGRYTLHDLLRQYVGKRVDSAEEQSQTAARHADYYLTFVHSQEAKLYSAVERTALDEIGAEIDNIRAAWGWALTHQQTAAVSGAVQSLYRFYAARNWFQEGEALFRQATTHLSSATLVYAKVAARLALFCYQLGDDRLARQLLQQSLALAVDGHDRSEAAFCQLGLVAVALRQGDYPAAQAAARASLVEYRQLADAVGCAQALNRLGDALQLAGQYTEAMHALEEALTLAAATPMPPLEADSRRILGTIHWNQGDYAAARASYEQAMRLYRDPRVANRQGEADALNQLGFVAWSQGNHDAAQEYFHAALHTFRQIGDRQGEGRLLGNLGRVIERQGNYRTAQAHYEQSLQLSRAIGDRAGEGVTLTSLGFLAFHQGDYTAAQAHFAAAHRVNAAIGQRHWEGLALACLGLIATLAADYAAADELCQQALAIAQAAGDRPIAGYALTHLGYALMGLGRLPEAEGAFREALALRTALGDLDRATEASAGLAQVALAQSQLATAQQHIESILQFLSTGSLERALRPFHIYATCYAVLAASQDGRADDLLRQAHTLLQEHAARISDETLRQAFLHHIPEHAALVRAYIVD